MPLTLDHPAYLIAAGLLLTLAVALVAIRRPRLRPLSDGLLLIGLACFALAAASPRMKLPVRPRVAVMVDLSPSTRTADYRDRRRLQLRLEQLLGRSAFDLMAFAAATVELSPTWGSTLPDLPADQTTLTPPPDADVVLLFTDARFDPPAGGPPLHVVADPALLAAEDAAIERLERAADRVTATVRNRGRPRTLTWSDSSSPSTGLAARTTVVGHVTDPAATITARLDTADVWPENDALSLAAAPPQALERWWISDHPAPGDGWRTLAPDDLPTDATGYLAPAVIVLDNIPADALPAASRLVQYVRDLGGAVLMIGGDRAYAAGGYDGTPLDALSPLASSPPEPRRHWLLLVDASGSMAAATADGQARWSLAGGAVRQALASLPPNDRVSVGGFADGITWWVDEASAAEAQRAPLPPPAVQPHGPTGLQQSLAQIAALPSARMPRELLLLTDGEATLDAADALAESLRAAKVRLHVMLTGPGPAAEPLRAIATQTGGRAIEAANPGGWAAGARTLARGATAEALIHSPVQLRAVDALDILTSAVSAWNRTWLKPGAHLLAEAAHDDQSVPMIARWQLGAGQVVATAFAMTPSDAARLADTIALPPRDPRFSVTIDSGNRLRVRVRAADGESHLNGLELQARLTMADTGQSNVTPIPQVAPGRYELDLPAPRQSVIVTVLHEGRPLDQAAIAGRYPPEFDGIGFDQERAAELATRTGGRLIAPEESGPIDLPMRIESRPIAGILTFAGLLLCAAALITGKRA